MSRRACGVIGSLVALPGPVRTGGPGPRPPLSGHRSLRHLPAPTLMLVAAALGCAALALAPGGSGPLAARAGLAATAIAVGWRLLRGRADPVPPAAVRVAASIPVGRSGEVAVVEVDGRRFLVAVGERPLSLLAELGPAPGRAP